MAAWIEDRYEVVQMRPETLANLNEYLWRSGKHAVAEDMRAFLRNLKP